MPPKTSCFTSIDSRKPDSSQKILMPRNRFKMCWIDALRIPAQMIKLQSVRNISTNQDVSDSMSRCESTVPFNMAIICIAEATNPKPTTRIGLWNHTLPKLIDQKFSRWRHFRFPIPERFLRRISPQTQCRLIC